MNIAAASLRLPGGSCSARLTRAARPIAGTVARLAGFAGSVEFGRPRTGTRSRGHDISAPGERERRILQELVSRAPVCLLILTFHELLGSGAENPLIRYLTALGVLLNGLYYLAARTGLRLHLQAYVRMLVDIALITVGLYSAGGLAAAPYVGIYVITPIYAGMARSTPSWAA